MKSILFTAFLGLVVLAPLGVTHADDKQSKDANKAAENGKTAKAKGDDAEDKASDAKTKKTIPRLAELRLDEKLVSARALNLPLPGSTRTVQELLDKLEEWTEDDKVGGILMDVGGINLALPDVEELRAAVQRAKDADKKVVAFLNAGGPNAYLLACAADEIALAPIGGIEIPGIGQLFPFMKGFYQLQGIEYQVITAGKYKYPGFLNRREPSGYFKEEFGTILDSMFDDYVDMIAEGRGLKRDQVLEIIDQGLVNAPEAQQRGLVDTLAYYDEYRDRVLKREKMKPHLDGEDGLENLKTFQDIMEWMSDRMQEEAKARKAVGPKIAVLHARGPIIDQNLGVGVASQLVCRDDFCKQVENLRKNKSIKAVVLRIDSPGGSGYASDVIWRHLRQLDEEKPLVVSMGNVAGSGGYYIACPARKIFAQPTTITGSIGVLGILQSQRSAFNRMDMELAEMKRGERSTMGAPHRALDKEDRAFIQKYIDDFYDIFIDRVATTRRRPESEIRKIAEGRIWTGRDALEIGLVDQLGGLHDAIESAREMANIPPSAELKILHYPRPGSLGELFDSLSPMVSVEGMEAYLQASKPARVSFAQQLSMLSQRFQPLCWMATPVLATAEPTWGWRQLVPQRQPGLFPTLELAP